MPALRYPRGRDLDPDATALARFVERNAPVLALTGAGVSTASGLPDFRSPGGLWERLDPMVDGHVDMLARDPGARLAVLGRAARRRAASLPNPAHAALARLELAGLIAGVVTQNIDGLHHAAGSEAVEVHGHLRSGALPAPAAPRRTWRPRSRATPRAGRAPECLRVRRHAAAAGRAVRRAAAAARPGRRALALAQQRRRVPVRRARRSRSTRRPGWPRRSRAPGGRSRSSRGGRPGSGRTPSCA